ncbi:MAG: right-handed parallel beta-helix repeat-containing protein [Myxococcaceae bacterium]
MKTASLALLLCLTVFACDSASALETVGATLSTPPPTSFRNTYHVSPNGQDSAAGSEAAPFATLQRALRAAQPGDGVLVHTGRYAERLAVNASVAAGMAEAPITVRAAPGEDPVLVGGTGSKTAVLTLSRPYWRFEGLNINLEKDPAPAVVIRGAAHLVFSGAELMNGTAGAAMIITDRASDVRVEGNRVHHFINAKPGVDSHGIVLETSASAVTLRGNDIHDNSGDGIQCIGPETGDTAPGTPFDSLLIEQNKLHDNLENGADIKTCTRVTLRRNEVFGHHPTPSSAGEGIIVHMSASNVLIEENALHDNSVAIVLGGVRVGAPPNDITVRRNRVWSSVDAGFGLRVNAAERVKLYNNTLSGLAGMCIIIGSAENGASKQVEVENNILNDCALAARVGPTYEGVRFDRNLFWNQTGAATLRVMGGPNLNVAAWRTKTGWDRASLEAAPQFVNPTAGDFSLSPTSPALNSGADVGAPFCGGAPDLGALEAPCL